MATVEEQQAVAAPPHYDAAERLWRDCVAIATQRAGDYFPESMAPTVERAKDICLKKDLWLDPIGTGGRVRSQTTPGKIYVVTQCCECEGSNFTPDEQPCKHLLALRIHQRAIILQDELTPKQQLPEAPVSLNTHLVIHGQQCQFTMRGFDLGKVLAEFEAFLAQIGDGSTAPAPEPLPETASNTPPPDAPPAPTPPAERHGEPPMCPRHSKPMRRSQYDDGKYFCSTKESDSSYCREKA